MAENFITESLHNGDSRQPEHFRLPGQTERTVNALPDLVRGAAKRPGTRLVTSINQPQSVDWRIHTIERDADTQYIVFHGYDTGQAPSEYVVLVYDKNGNQITNTITTAAQDYLRQNATPAQDMRFVTIADSTYIINPSVAVDVLPTPDYTVTETWGDQAQVFRHTPDDGTYHYATAEDAYWVYGVDGKTFGTAQFTTQTGPRTRPSGEWDRAGTHAARIQFGRYDLAVTTGLSVTPNSPTTGQHTLSGTGAFVGYDYQAGDKVGVTSGTGLSGASYAVDIWFDVVSKTSDNAIVFEDNAPVTRYDSTAQSDWAANYIGPRYIASYTSNGVAESSMQDIAQAITDGLNGQGARDALAEWVDVAGEAGYFIITTPTRGANAKVIEGLSGSDPNIGESLIDDRGVDLAEAGEGRAFETIDSSTEGTGTVTAGTDDALLVTGRWTQVPMPNATDGSIDPDTMPVRLFLNTDGEFDTQQVTWSARVLGDNVTNPTPDLWLKADLRGGITEITQASNAVVTSASHGLVTGDVIDIRGTNSDIRLDGRRTVTVLTTDTFTVGVDTTGLGTGPWPGGRWSRGAATINDATYHRGRLVFVGDEYLVASRQDDLTDFYLENPEQVEDTDRITVSPGIESITILRSVTPVRNTLVLSSDNGYQFEVTSTGAFTPGNVAIDPSTRHRIVDVGFTQVGPGLYFASAGTNEAQLREYLYVEQIVTSDTSDESAHARGYFPTTITRLTGDGDSQCVFLLEADQRTVYGFRVSWAGREKVQQAWFTWTFGTDILDISCMGGNLWMLTRDNDRFALEKLPILGEAPTEGIPWEVHLDRQFSVTGVDNGSNTRFSVPGLIADTSTIDAFVLGSTFGDTGFEITAADTGAWTYAGAADNIDVPDASDIYRAGPVVMGTQYEMLSEPSRPYFRTDSGQAILGTATRSNRQVVRLSGGLAVLTTDPTPSNFTSTTKTFDPGDGSILERDAIMTSLLSFDNATFTITSTDARPLEIHYVGFQCSPGRPT